MFTAAQLVAHAIGDYVIQSDYMASEKVKKSTACLAHVITYSICFIPFTCSWNSHSIIPTAVKWYALLAISVSHFIIDRWRIARYICWIKNHLAPRYIILDPSAALTGNKKNNLIRSYPWSECSATGYDQNKPIWMAFWLMIITDNCMHVICNALALRFL